MRPKTNAEFAAALNLQSHYATDSEGRWLLEECSKIIASIDSAPVAAAPAESAPEQNAPAAAKVASRPDKLPRVAKTKVAE